MALRRTMPIKPRPITDPPRPGDQVYDPKRGGWYPAPPPAPRDA